MIEHKGVVGEVSFDEVSRIFRGRAAIGKDFVTFYGATREAAEADFIESVDDYIEFREELGRPYRFADLKGAIADLSAISSKIHDPGDTTIGSDPPVKHEDFRALADAILESNKKNGYQ